MSTLVDAGGAFYLPGGQWWRTIGPAHLGTVATGARDASVVLVTAAAVEYYGLAGVELGGPHGFVDHAIAAGWEVDPPVLSRWWKVRPATGGRWLSVLVLPWDAADGEPVATPWCNVEDVQQLMRGLARFAATVGMPWRDTVGRTTEALILATHPRERGGVLMDKAPTVPPPAAVGTLEQPIVWRRPLADNERRAGHVHAYDMNAQYLAAWQSVELGLGEPEHLEVTAFDQRVAGLWRLDEAWLTVLRSIDLGPLPPGWSVRNEWFTTPTMLRICEVIEEVPAIAEAWCWPRKSRFLRGAGERLRDARTQLLREAGMDPAAAVALDAVKGCYRRETGRFNMSREGRARSQWHRPDWGHLIRATARVNLHRIIAGAPRKTTDDRPALAAAPFAIATDGLLFATDVEDPAVFAHDIGLPIGSGLGQFEVKGTFKLSPERVDELDAARNAPATYRILRGWAA